MEEIRFENEDDQTPRKADTIGFVRDHVKNKTTALETIHIYINDNTNCEAFCELLANSPEASTFLIVFCPSELDVQDASKRYWTIYQSVLFCNSNDKNLTFDHGCCQELHVSCMCTEIPLPLQVRAWHRTQKSVFITHGEALAMCSFLDPIFQYER